MQFVTDIYHITQNFLSFEIYGLANQLRRAAVSIPSNIAEGSARQSNKERLQFLYIAAGSCAEVETQLLIAKDLNYSVPDQVFDDLGRVRRMLNGLIRHVKSNPQSPISNPGNQKETF